MLIDRLAGWWRSRVAKDDPARAPLDAWRARAAGAWDGGTAAEVRAVLDERGVLGATDEDTEVEVERLQARLDLIALDERLARGDLPDLHTQHRAVGQERCVLVAPAVWCAADADLPGKLFVTEHRVRFAGGPGFSLRWSAIAEVVARDRDLLVRLPGSGETRLVRCNTFGDARAAARLIEFFKTK